MSLRGAHALVTGGGRGIGAAIASALAAAGARLTLLGRDRAALDAHAATLPAAAEAFVVSADVADADEVGAAFSLACARHGDVGVLVNNAGSASSGAFAKLDPAEWERLLRVNLGGTYACTREVVPAMVRARAGRIVNVASTAGLVGRPYVAAYTAAKHGVIGLTRALAAELAPHGDHRQRGLPRLHRDAAAGAHAGEHRRADRAQPRRRGRCAAGPQPAGPLRAAGRSRERRRMAVRRRRGRHHRPGDRDRRRRGDAVNADAESRASEADHLSVRLWLRLLACTTLIERRVSAGLREGFDTTLPRFDFLSQLERSPAGLRMTEISQRMMVTGGNITRIADGLLAEGLITRSAAPGDRRASVVRLTPAGRSTFAAMARRHESWIVAMFGGLHESERGELYALLAKLKRHLTARESDPTT